MGGVQCTSLPRPGRSNHTFHIADAWDAPLRHLPRRRQRRREEIRLVHLLDYDGDGNTTEPSGGGDRRAGGTAARGDAGGDHGSGGICYDEHANPYFFKDSDGDGACSAAEATSANAFAACTPALMKAAHNYQLSKKDPGSWAHNFKYSAQLLYDSVEDVSGATPMNLTRP